MVVGLSSCGPMTIQDSVTFMALISYDNSLIGLRSHTSSIIS